MSLIFGKRYEKLTNKTLDRNRFHNRGQHFMLTNRRYRISFGSRHGAGGGILPGQQWREIQKSKEKGQPEEA